MLDDKDDVVCATDWRHGHLITDAADVKTEASRNTCGYVNGCSGWKTSSEAINDPPSQIFLGPARSGPFLPFTTLPPACAHVFQLEAHRRKVLLENPSVRRRGLLRPRRRGRGVARRGLGRGRGRGRDRGRPVCDREQLRRAAAEVVRGGGRKGPRLAYTPHPQTLRGRMLRTLLKSRAMLFVNSLRPLTEYPPWPMPHNH